MKLIKDKAELKETLFYYLYKEVTDIDNNKTKVKVGAVMLGTSEEGKLCRAITICSPCDKFNKKTAFTICKNRLESAMRGPIITDHTSNIVESTTLKHIDAKFKGIYINKKSKLAYKKDAHNVFMRCQYDVKPTEFEHRSMHPLNMKCKYCNT